MDLPAETEISSGSPSLPRLAGFTVTMDSREGRAGNAFACERCRKHKVRCVPSDTPSICQRCSKAKVECVEHVARRRPAKSRHDGHTPNKMRDFDRKLDKLSAIVATMAPPLTPKSAPAAAILSLQESEAPQQTLTTPQAQPPTTAPIPSSAVPESERNSTFWESIDLSLSSLGRVDPIIRSISHVHMQMLLDTYQRMVDYFPFVPLPRDYSCEQLAQRRPTLMLAILTAASYDSVHLQLNLGREFRKIVMVKIMNGEKSLDLLQGIIVFIAWHHHYVDTQAVSISTLLQMCIGIAGDLGLDKLLVMETKTLHKEDTKDREGKRAYLGCYYLATNLGLTEPRKARVRLSSGNLRACASELIAAWEHRTDVIIPIMIDVCQFMEDIEETFHGQSEEAVLARSQVRRLSDKWESIRLASKTQASDFKTLQWAQLASRVVLHKSALSIDISGQDDTAWATSFQLSLRIASLRSTEQFLDNALKMTPEQYDLISLIDWLNLLSTVTSLGKLALHASPMPGWDPGELQLTKSFDYYRDSLSSLMPHPRDAPEVADDVYERFRRVTAAMKTAVRNAPSRGSPNGGTFELATGSGRTVSLLQDLPLPQQNGTANGVEKLPAMWNNSPTLDMNNHDFQWKFLMGTV